MQTYLISYDITDNNLRLKAAKLILRAGAFRVQRSVFMGTLSDTTAKHTRKNLQTLSQHPRWATTDTLLILPLHDYSRKSLELLGNFETEWGLIYRELHTLVV
jgi:CRISPR-associated endonuclease Cas2